MTNNFVLACISLAAFSICAPAGAQAPAEGLYIDAKSGQSAKQQATDRYECHTWAIGQTGFDSTRPGGGVAATEYASRRNAYQRAMAACLEARGYSVSTAPVAPAPQPVAPPPPRYVAPVYTTPVIAVPALNYHPIEVQLEGGYSVTAGGTNRNLDDGSNAGLGLTWTPTASLPLALRIDGSYSWFDDRRQFLNLSGAGYAAGHEDIYGGDADLQLDLAHRSSRQKMYLFGGAGLYRESSEVRSFYPASGPGCNFYFCQPFGYAAVERTTSNWHDAWNAGLGWEIALADRGSFFIEARYLRIKPNDSNLQFVPIRVGLRF